MKNEVLDKAVIEFKGVWPEGWVTIVLNEESKNFESWPPRRDAKNLTHVCTKKEFTQRAKELGFINGYRYGVEYPTNGKKPDLDDDVVVCIDGGCSASSGDSVDGWNWNKIKSFRITDQRYRPADTSYLNASSQNQSLTHSEEGLTHSDWWDYVANKRNSNPPVGQKLLFDDSDVMTDSVILYIGKEKMLATIADGSDTEYCMSVASLDFYYPLDHATRKADLEKKHVVDAAIDAAKIGRDKSVKLNPCVEHAIERLYDAGYLRLPDQK